VLHAAAMANNASLVQAASAMLQPSKPPTDHRGWTPWHWAAAADAYVAIFDLATRRRPPLLFTSDHSSRTPLHAACAAGASLALRASLALVTDVAQRRRICRAVDVDGMTPLHIACARGDAACAVLLMSACALSDIVPVSAPRVAPLIQRTSGSNGHNTSTSEREDDEDVDLLGPSLPDGTGAGDASPSGVPVHVRIDWDRLRIADVGEDEDVGDQGALQEHSGDFPDTVDHFLQSVSAADAARSALQSLLQVRDAQGRTAVTVAVASGNEALLKVMAVVCRPPTAPPTPFLVDRDTDELVWRWWHSEQSDAASARSALQSLEDLEAAGSATLPGTTPRTPGAGGGGGGGGAGGQGGSGTSSLPKTHILDLDAAYNGLRSPSFASATAHEPAQPQHPLLSLPLGDLMQTFLVPQLRTFEVLVDVRDGDLRAASTASVLVEPAAVPPAVLVSLPHDHSLATLTAAVDDRVPMPPDMPAACTLVLRGLRPAQTVHVRVRAKNERGWGPFSAPSDAVAVSNPPPVAPEPPT
jgi:ankyrin repeat protein